MNIGIVGLGLIGGSIAKAIKKGNEHTVFAYDKDMTVMLSAKMTQSIDYPLNADNLKECDIIFLALYPSATINYIKENIGKIKKSAIIIDCCGIKKVICDELFTFCNNNNVLFIGGHPMAGREVSGFSASKANLFKDASFIITPPKEISIEQIQTVKNLFTTIGISTIKVATPEQHDKIIACTSQLAHIVSSAYVKSPTATDFKGFSAGSFKDMTRVAKLNPEMWTELFFDNRENLLFEVNSLIDRLKEYSEALENNDTEKMKELLEEGNKIKCAIR